MFLEFYEGKEHFRRKSFSLIPEKDKSLLIINSGMAPLKPYFAGVETPPSKRMTTCQKCIRTGDIDNVGYTARHGTFFEMLGSFSFGDYFKEESIRWGYEFMIEKLRMPLDKLWATIYEDDDEAFEIWSRIIGLPEERIVRLGKDDNFWEIGIGPCGPCSEIYFDRGESYGCDNPDCKPGCDCDRYVEFWNHVFTQFSRDSEGNYTPLAQKNIDTGMGLERLACIMQGVDSIFDVDTIRYILQGVVEKSGIVYQEGKAKTDVSIRIITDHIRSVTFMVADGILPGNEGRGYVLRRLLRRAARHGKILGITGGFLAELSERVIAISGDAYPELEEKKDYIRRILTIEEEKFSNTIDQGTLLLSDDMNEMAQKGKTVLSGEKAFKLYDTFGFPVELTQEILAEQGYTVDEQDFRARMAHQKEIARAARKSETDAGWSDGATLLSGAEPTVFVGYDMLSADSDVVSVFKGTVEANSAAEGEEVIVLLDRTPFYAESGGQAGDIGIIENDSFRAEVISVSKNKGVFLHRVLIEKGTIHTGDRVSGQVDILNRNRSARNHTATHLLHQALKEVVGEHVGQAGSSVGPETLRFDFSHFEAVSKEDLQRVEEIVNEKIGLFLPVTAEEMSIEEAKKTGAVAQFGEKYGAIVRVVKAGAFSCEFCGGTHVSNTGQIGAFKILSEAGVAAGVRRIEGITGPAVLERLTESELLISKASELLKANSDNFMSRLTVMNDEWKAQKKELEMLKQKDMGSSVDDIVEKAPVINGIRLITSVYQDCDVSDLRNLCDQIKARHKNCIIVLASDNDGKVTFIVSVSDDLLEKGYHAGNLIKQIAAAAGGGGGGKADMAQAGAKDASKIPDAFKVAESLL